MELFVYPPKRGEVSSGFVPASEMMVKGSEQTFFHEYVLVRHSGETGVGMTVMLLTIWPGGLTTQPQTSHLVLAVREYAE